MIIADDLSGACDTAVQFRKFGYPTVVLNHIEKAKPLFDRYAAMAITTNSRDLPACEAVQAVHAIGPFLKKLKHLTFYKKIDSTWRGNIGAELEVLLDELQLGFAIICSAFPENMRLGVGGYLMVDGRLLHHTPMAKDPASPIMESFLPDLLARQSDLPVELLAVKLIESGVDAVRGFILEKIQQGPCFFIADATETEHLDTIADIGTKGLPPYIFAGSAGLSAAVIGQRKKRDKKPSRPILSVVGSVHPKSTAQIDKLIETHHISDIYVPWDPLLHGKQETLETVCTQAAEILGRGDDLVLRTCRSADDADAATAEGRKAGMSGTEVAMKISESIRDVVVDVLSRTTVEGLMVTGGTTALKLLEGFAGDGIEVLREIEPGVPLGCIVGGKCDGMPILTKAGGFGSPDVFCTGLEIMKIEE
jgi:uncharacterized protein YgbK (DUF1537 family)